QEVAARYNRGDSDRARLSIEDARANAVKLDWSAYDATPPRFAGTKTLADWDLAEIARYIDWTPFFHFF
ncbi:hypothetical protein, partial [Pseudomonas syringae group genomosp. 7]|uniref:hypothetical protein n=1 Tax=Pseudomonas syringae group genomosp. 7 TaxID=251699 RepID=UPI00376F7AFD